MMSRKERDDLSQLSRQREKLAKIAVDARGSEMKADFEKQLAAEYSYDTNENWAAAEKHARDAVVLANKMIHEEAKKLGIPVAFAPEVHMAWYPRGENLTNERRSELRKVANSRIDAMVRQAKLEIEAASVEIRTQLIASTLESPEAIKALKTMPTATALMPNMLTVEEVRKRQKQLLQ